MNDVAASGRLPLRPDTHPKLPPSREATVVLDIGDGIGALVVRAPASLAGVEIEIAPHGEDEACMHTEVRERRLPEDTVYAAVFPAVAEGRYALLDTEGEARRHLTIRSGSVTEVDW